MKITYGPTKQASPDSGIKNCLSFTNRIKKNNNKKGLKFHYKHKIKANWTSTNTVVTIEQPGAKHELWREPGSHARQQSAACCETQNVP